MNLRRCCCFFSTGCFTFTYILTIYFLHKQKWLFFATTCFILFVFYYAAFFLFKARYDKQWLQCQNELIFFIEFIFFRERDGKRSELKGKLSQTEAATLDFWLKRIEFFSLSLICFSLTLCQFQLYFYPQSNKNLCNFNKRYR